MHGFDVRQHTAVKAATKKQWTLLCDCARAAVAAAARSMKASWRALATASKPEAGEAAAVQRETT